MGRAGWGLQRAGLLSVTGSRGGRGVVDKHSEPGSLGISEISGEHLGLGWGTS